VRQLVGKSLFEVLQILIPGQLSEAKFHLGGSQPFEIPIESLASVAAVEAPPVESPPVESMPAEASGAPASEAGAGESSAPPASPKANNRLEAFALLEQVAAYYRITEPSSPISLILDRARSFANRDFLAVLKDLLAKPTSG